MKGKHSLTIQSAHLKYDMEFSRNITVIQGDSATGKTTLVDMIQEYLLNGTDTGITLSCDCPCRIIAGATWEEQLAPIENSIVFVDEGNRFVSSLDFARAVRGSSNYFVIITREALDNLPYSVTEIYGIRSSGKFQSLEPVYHQMYRIYGDLLDENSGRIDRLIAEDSNSGYEFFSGIMEGSETKCISAGGASKVFDQIQAAASDESIVVIADGAAFGSQMGRIYRLTYGRQGVSLYLPDSFEWMILSADILDDAELRQILDAPYDYIDSESYFSWERFWTSLLIQKTEGQWMKYSKAKLNPVYLQGGYREKIISVMPEALRQALDL